MSILVTRFIGALILHLQLESEVLQAKNFIKVTIHRVRPWNKAIPMIFVALMQLTVSLLTEMLNILVICSLTKLSEIIVNCVQFQMIAQIDNYYAKSQKNSFLLALVQRTSIHMCADDQDKKQVKEKLVAWYHHAFYFFLDIIHKCLRIFYSAFYFYFTPYLVIYLSFVIGESKNQENKP